MIKKTRNILNTDIGAPRMYNNPTLTNLEENNLLASLFEQFLLFDKIVITTNRVNSALTFLIKKLGLNLVEEIIERDYLRFMIWAPQIVTSVGRDIGNGAIDKSTIFGQPPIVGGSLGDEDLDPKNNILQALNNFPIHSDRKRILIRKVQKKYIAPNGMNLATESVDIVIDAYKNNAMIDLNLPYKKEPNMLGLEERSLLQKLGHAVLETAVLAKYNLKSFNNFEHFNICKQNIENIGKAYKISENSANIFKLENLPNLKELYLDNKLQFEQVFKIRNLSTAKYYRRWINEIGEESDANEITQEYLAEIKGTNKFINTNQGKFLRGLCSFAVGTAVGTALAGPVGIGVGLGLGLLDNIWLSNILAGKNPSMFIEEIKKTI